MYRAYQNALVNDVGRAISDGAKSILLVAPTGSGKTKIISKALKRARRTPIAIAHRREICKQIDTELCVTGPEKYVVAGIASSKLKPYLESDVYDTVFIDEAHHAPATSYRRIINNLRDKVLLGATATPYRADNASVAQFFDKIIVAPSARKLTDAGHLAQVEYVSSDTVDFEGIRITRKNEYDEAESLDRVRIAVQAGDVVSAWSQYAKGKNAIIYAINIEHSEQIHQELSEVGVPVEVVTSRSTKRQRDAAIRRFGAGEIRGLINCQVFTEGTDVPNVGAIIMLRPTLSRALYKQMIGRGMRPDISCVVIDHVGNYLRHGKVMDECPISIMNEGREKYAQQSSYTVDHSADYIKMALDIVRVQDDLKKIWTPSIFGVAQ